MNSFSATAIRKGLVVFPVYSVNLPGAGAIGYMAAVEFFWKKQNLGFDKSRQIVLPLQTPLRRQLIRPEMSWKKCPGEDGESVLLIPYSQYRRYALLPEGKPKGDIVDISLSTIESDLSRPWVKLLYGGRSEKIHCGQR